MNKHLCKDQNFCQIVVDNTLPGYGNDYLPWLYTRPLQNKGGC